MPDAQTKRLFFALYPPATIRQQIRRSVVDLVATSVKQVPKNNLHLTLLYMGASTASQQSDYLTAANTIHAQSFHLELDYLDQFDKAKILWLGARQVPENLTCLHNLLLTALQSVGFEPPALTYVPHVTLARHFRGPTPAYNSRIAWDVHSFSLMESRSTDLGVSYIELQRWPMHTPR